MRRRNDSGRDRKDSSARGRRSSSDRRPGKPFRKSTGDTGTSSSKPFARKRTPRSEGGQPKDRERGGERLDRSSSKKFSNKGSSAARPFGKKGPRSEGRPFKTSFRRSDQDTEKKPYTGRPYRESTEGKGAARKSRFASDHRKSDGAARQHDDTSKPRRSRPRTPEGIGNARGASFGKPYKKTYKQKPEGPYTSSRKRNTDEAVSAPKSDKVRLNKFIANSGVASRREADELITMGLISVNGTVITELGYKVNPGDEVRYEDKVLRPERPVYILMNKPKGFLTTTDDPQERKTVMHIIGSAVRERIYPVGRLDRNTTGLLLLTNDGELADKLMHPSFNVKKVYKVELDRPMTKNDLQAIQEGVRLEEGRAVVDDVAIVSDDGRTVGIELHIGWNRVVRRIFESLGYEVKKLDRTVYAGLDKKELGRGQWRFLTKQEIIHLKHFN